ncbi:hypothetical protein ACO2Q2_17065 [Dyella sp. KRB-257]|uniref:hypothetical protein n=1 Tax=Dyella sp. KRB-257 TaxID=3400915 RepID=UPI003BFF0709
MRARQWVVMAGVWTMLGAAQLAHGATPETFDRSEGLNLNRFVRQGDVAAHIVLRSGTEPRLIVAFPAGNSGVGLWFDPVAAPATWTLDGPATPLTQADARGRPLHGVRFTATLRTPTLVPKQALLSSIRVLRDYQGQGTAPKDVLTSARTDGNTLAWSRDRLDGAPGYALNVTAVHGALHNGHFVAASDGTITLKITALSGETPLTPVSGHALLNDSARDDRAAREALGFLSYREKYLAGSWRFDTYFGRDTLMSVRLLMPALQPAAVETGLRSVLQRLSPDGQVAHEEDIGEFAILDHMKHDGTRSDAPVYDYKMVDSDYLLAPVTQAWLLDDARGRARAGAFLASKLGEAHAGEALMRNLRYVAAQTRAFAVDPTTANLVSLKPGVPVGDWRDSNDGLGGGRYAYDVNAILIPAALDAASALYRSGLLAPYANAQDQAMLAGLAHAAAVWRDKAPALFTVIVDNAAARQAITTYAKAMDVPAAPALKAIGDKPVQFQALSLDASGQPIRVQNSDGGFALLFGKPSPAQLDAEAELLRRPFPAGLMTPVGMLVANPAFAPAAEQARFSPGAYHGTVVWSWQQALTAAGLARQLARTDLPAATRRNLQGAQACLWQAIDATRDMSNSELWSWRYADGRYQVAAFGASGKDADESNAAQLWSTVYLAIPKPANLPTGCD